MIRKVLIAGLLIALLLGAKAWHDTMRAPVVQRHIVESAKLPAGSPPVIIALLADIHVAGPDMPPSRLTRIVGQVNTLEPDVVMIAGDLVSEKRTATHVYEPDEIVAPLANLDAPLGTVIVPGNHDHWYDWPGLRAELNSIERVTVLENDAVQLGPLAVGGVDDDFTGRADLDATFAAQRGMDGVKVTLTHSPDVFPQVPVDNALVLAGHTHSGQIAYPWGGSPATMSDYGQRYACGVVRQHGKTLVTSAGIGTSLLPLRLFTQPEIWVIEVRPAAQ